MGWIPYPTSLNSSAPAAGQPVQRQGTAQPYGALPQAIRDQYAGAQQLQAAATSAAPHSSGMVNGMQALAGYMGGQAQNQADAAAAPYQGQAGSEQQSLLAKILRMGGGSSDPSAPVQLPGAASGAAGPGYGPGMDPAALQSSADSLKQAMGRKSDRRLKSDVRRVGALPNGLALYRYRLEGSPLFEVGVMADEAMAFDPAAVWEAEDGFLRVDYSRLVRR